ncbi:hypothetical protein C8R44DRAFT_989977 [Mycena epipterygia]|nr:hypothetical protein C8R44DRAFT_989977 [Mycena epipterygia]
MRMHPVFAAFALSLVSLVAAQSPSSAMPSATGIVTGTPLMYPGPSFTEFFNGTTARPSSAEAVSTAIAVPQANPTPKGSIVGAAVGGSVAACLVVLAGVLFLRRRARARASQHTAESDFSRRCADLESQVFVLREQVNRLEAQQVRFVGFSGGFSYTHEKDAQALEKGADTKSMKEAPPTYGD